MTLPVAAYDAVASGIIYALFNNTQSYVFDEWVVSGDPDDPSTLELEVSGEVLLAFGGPAPNLLVKYYEYNNISPIKFMNMPDKYAFINTTTGEVIAYLEKPVDFKHEDLFVIEMFIDEENNIAIIFYGLDWRGTWATSIYVNNLTKQGVLTELLTNNVLIYHWIDENNNTIPEPNEIHQVYP